MIVPGSCPQGPWHTRYSTRTQRVYGARPTQARSSFSKEPNQPTRRHCMLPRPEQPTPVHRAANHETQKEVSRRQSRSPTDFIPSGIHLSRTGAGLIRRGRQGRGRSNLFRERLRVLKRLPRPGTLYPFVLTAEKPKAQQPKTAQLRQARPKRRRGRK